jgi:hypothetical protein
LHTGLVMASDLAQIVSSVSFNVLFAIHSFTFQVFFFLID